MVLFDNWGGGGRKWWGGGREGGDGWVDYSCLLFLVSSLFVLPSCLVLIVLSLFVLAARRVGLCRVPVLCVCRLVFWPLCCLVLCSCLSHLLLLFSVLVVWSCCV